MGNIEQIKSQQSKTSQEALSLKNYDIHSTLSNGQTIVKLEDGKLGLFLSKTLTSQSQKKKMEKWTNNTFQYCCNILNTSEESANFVCSHHLNIKAIIKYGDSTLAKKLQQKNVKDNQNSTERILSFLDQKQQNSSSMKDLQFVKFLLQVVQEILLYNKEWASFHPNDLIYFSKQDTFKYLYLPQVGTSLESQTFFDPQTILEAKNSQLNTVFSIGMVLMSLLLKEDCSDCYNYRNFTFCRSNFQQKKERVKDMLTNSNFSQCSFSDNISSCDEGLASLVLIALSEVKKRPSFNEFKLFYFRILRKLSNFDYDLRMSINKRDLTRNTNIRKSYSRRIEMRRQGNDENKVPQYRGKKTEKVSFGNKDVQKHIKNRLQISKIVNPLSQRTNTLN